jgi:hypothetical protein
LPSRTHPAHQRETLIRFARGDAEVWARAMVCTRRSLGLLSRLLSRLYSCPSSPLRSGDLPACSCREFPFAMYGSNLLLCSSLFSNFGPTRSLSGCDPRPSRCGEPSSSCCLSVCITKSCQCSTDSAKFPGQPILFLLQVRDNATEISHESPSWCSVSGRGIRGWIVLGIKTKQPPEHEASQTQRVTGRPP